MGTGGEAGEDIDFQMDFGGCRITNTTPIGGGGMGKVYEGVHLETGLAVAIKVHAEPYRQGGARHSYAQAESEVHAALSAHPHPNLVRFIVSGPNFLVTELLPEGNIRDFIRHNGAFSEAASLELALAICDGLRAVHERGLAYRDLKPENICLVTDPFKESSAKLIDFGLTTEFSASGPINKGFVLGTPQYMSPEQAMGCLLDARSDIYALGAVLYFLLTGEHAHNACTPQELVTEAMRDDFALPRDHRLSRIKPGIRELVMRLLQFRKDKRPSTAHEVADEIRKLLATIRSESYTLMYEGCQPSGERLIYYNEDAPSADPGGEPPKEVTPVTRVTEQQASKPETNAQAAVELMPPPAPTVTQPFSLIMIGVLVGAITGVAVFGGWTLISKAYSDRAVAVLPRPAPAQRHHVPSPTVRAPDLAPSQPPAPPPPLQCWSRRGAGRNLPFLRIGDRKVARDPRCWELTPPAERAHTCRHLRRRHYETSPRFHGYCDGY